MAIINLGKVVGRGITKIEKTSTVGLVDTYTITYSDNTTSTYTVTNGANGTGSSTPATGNGLTVEQITALDEMFKRCVFTEDISTVYVNFKTAFGLTESGGDTPSEPEQPTVTTYTITRSLTNCTSNKSITSINENTSYSETFTAKSGYTLEGATVTVTMGGTNISSSYSNGTLNISKVTGNIIISVTAVLIPVEPEEPEIPVDPTEPVYVLAEPTTFDGATSIDTGYKLNDVDKDFSILVDYMPTASGGHVFDSSKNANLFGPRLNLNDGTIWIVNKYTVPMIAKDINNKIVITHVKGSDKFTYHIISDNYNYSVSHEHSAAGYGTNSHAIGNSNTLKLGSNYTGTANFFTGTITQFKIFERVITEEEVKDFINATWEDKNNGELINLINKDTLNGDGMNMPDGRAITSDYYVTDFIEVTPGNPYVCNITKYIDSTTTAQAYCYSYNEAKTYKTMMQSFGTGEPSNYSAGTWTNKAMGIKFIRLVFHKSQLETALYAEGKV